MKYLIILFTIFCLIPDVYPQSASTYQGGINGEANLQAIANLSPNSAGAVGFDTRYEGVKGSVRLFDSLLTSFLLVKGRDKYIEFLSDIDVVNNNILFTHPKNMKLMELPSDVVKELIIKKEDKELKFTTTKGAIFKKALKENKFCQILVEEPYRFIKIPGKLFIEANFKGPYSIDRRYDEYRSEDKYYIEDENNVFQQVQLNKRSLAKLFPEKKALINISFEDNSGKDSEEIVISLLKQF
ncbi:MAG: hypothetical protein JXN62_13560 [Bacteroidales bacterium]|nr:hypothetical protein [Bacteroidales bacterium]